MKYLGKNCLFYGGEKDSFDVALLASGISRPNFDGSREYFTLIVMRKNHSFQQNESISHSP